MRWYILLISLAVGICLQAQCTSCSIIITGIDANDHQIGIGQVMCVQPTGTLTGRIYISSGGKLCNQGHINSREIGIAFGGQFDNYNVANMDTLYIGGAGAVVNNYDTMVTNIFYAGASGAITNNGTLTSTIYGDTGTTFINNGRFSIQQNMYVGNTSTFYNYSKIHVGRNLYTGISANLLTTCTITIDSNWYNSGTINGPMTGCGGFAIGGQSYNSGTVGASGHVDLCDAGHPVAGIDGNSGTMTGVTFCQCTDTCTDMPNSIGAVNDKVAFKIFPNPAADRLQITFEEEREGSIILYNTLGEAVQRHLMPKGTKEMILNTSALDNGLYILSVETDGSKATSKIQIMK